jgi:hypothetical protein
VSGCPFGSKARVILLNLVDRAIRCGTPTVEIGPSMRAWLLSIGVAPGGMSYIQATDQGRRLGDCAVAACNVGGEVQQGTPAARIRSFIAGTDLDAPYAAVGGRYHAPPDIGSICPRRVFLDAGFFDYARTRHFAVDRLAIQQISNNGWAIDVYLWLASWLPSLAAPLQISWFEVCRNGFGDHGPLHKIKAKLLSTLPLVIAVYPQARISVHTDGMLLRPSPPAI